MENIDDECDSLGITFVKIDNIDEAKEYGVDDMPGLLYFEKGIPTVYEGRLEDEEAVLKWLEAQTTSDEIEDITDEMLDLILEKMPYVAVLFCKIISPLVLILSLFLFHTIYKKKTHFCGPNKQKPTKRLTKNVKPTKPPRVHFFFFVIDFEFEHDIFIEICKITTNDYPII